MSGTKKGEKKTMTFSKYNLILDYLNEGVGESKLVHIFNEALSCLNKSEYILHRIDDIDDIFAMSKTTIADLLSSFENEEFSLWDDYFVMANGHIVGYTSEDVYEKIINISGLAKLILESNNAMGDEYIQRVLDCNYIVEVKNHLKELHLLSDYKTLKNAIDLYSDVGYNLYIPTDYKVCKVVKTNAERRRS